MKNKNGDDEKILITKELLEEIQDAEYYSSQSKPDSLEKKKRRSVHLLKKPANLEFMRKKRVIKDLFTNEENEEE